MKAKNSVWGLFRLTFKASKKFYLIATFRALVNAFKSLVAVYGLGLIILSLTNQDYLTALYYALGIVLAETIIRFFELTFENQTIILQLDMEIKIKRLITDKLMKVEFKYLEDSKYLAAADQAKFAVDNFQDVHFFLGNVIVILEQFFTICSLLTLIILFKPIIIVVIIISVIAHLIVSNIARKKENSLYAELGPVNRKLNYFGNAVQDERYQKDYRIYPLGDLIYHKYTKFLDETCDYLIYFNKVTGRHQIYYSIINFIQVVLIYLIIATSSILDGTGVSTYIILTASALRASGAIDVLAQRISQAKRNVQRLAPVFQILNMEDSITLSKAGYECMPLEEITFRNVTFAYPGSDKVILENITFTIKKGEKISIVGLNGAGKTTIVKLISRFYQPTSGEILWNGINIDKYEYHSYLNQISAVFQDFKLFALTISENVDLEEKDKEKIQKCLYQVGLKDKIESLPNKIDSFLSKQYDSQGIELSGGEKQRVAIARAMYQNSSLAILDEPTSALDPLTEAEIYEHFDELVKDKTTIYISHRMSSSVFCDKIIVISEGKIIDINNHTNLMKKTDSMYYNLFQAQANYYQ